MRKDKAIVGNLFTQLVALLQKSTSCVLVSVAASTGSTPRGAGARMLVTQSGIVGGTIGGGAVEHRCEVMAQQLLATKQSAFETFQLHKNEVLDLGMICGGTMDVCFHYFDGEDAPVQSILQDIIRLYNKGENLVILEEVANNTLGAFGYFCKSTGFQGVALPFVCAAQLTNSPTLQQLAGVRYFAAPLQQPSQVYIFGGGHVSQALVPILATVDFHCVVLEDREAFCQAELFGNFAETCLIDNANINKYVTLTQQDYAVIMTRGHKDDQLIQSQVLHTPACYIGVIGSRRKTAQVFANLRDMGHTDQQLARIVTPIGLAIGAQTPAEIAISIAAQLIQKRAELQTKAL